MPNKNGHARVCPTRIDAAAALFTHRVTAKQCQDRQRGRYHKCFTCAFNNEYVAVHGPPENRPRVPRTRLATAQPQQPNPVESEPAEASRPEADVVVEARAV